MSKLPGAARGLPRLDHAGMAARADCLMATLSEQDALRHRDVAGREMETLAAIASGAKTMTRADIAAYIRSLVAQSADLVPQELRRLPRSKQQMRLWARKMFAMMMHVGVHGHAAYPRSKEVS